MFVSSLSAQEQTRYYSSIDQKTRRLINDAALGQFLSAWDPSWRWMLLLGLRDLRKNTGHLGDIAAEKTGADAWRDDRYLMGPVALGLTAAAVNETALHCEDMFAFLKFAGEPESFVRRMTSYSPGQVIRFGKDLLTKDEAEIRKLFFVPSPQRIAEGLSTAEDPVAASAVAEEGVARLTDMTKRVVQWYETYEAFHLQYKHGLKIPLRPFGDVTQEAVDERKGSTKAPVFAFSNEPISAMPRRPPSQQALLIPLNAVSQPYLSDLAKERGLLHYHLAGPEVDLDDLVALSWTVVRLLRFAINNRLALANGVDPGGQQLFHLPADESRGTVELLLQPSFPFALDSFS